jgi:hypothetical protein
MGDENAGAVAHQRTHDIAVDGTSKIFPRD